MEMMRDKIADHISKEYKIKGENLFQSYPDYVIFRHPDNHKWFAIIMYVKRSVLGLDGDGYADIMNVKADPAMIGLMTSKEGCLPGYHMNRKYWMSLLLDGTVPEDTILSLLDESFGLTASKKDRTAKAWLIPSNPKYYDIVGAFEKSEEILWKMGKGIREGDTVYMYVGAPYSAVLYGCRVTETDIPYRGHNEKVNISSLMKIRRFLVIDPGRLTLAKLGSYGVYTVRGPRGVPAELLRDLRRMEKE